MVSLLQCRVTKGSKEGLQKVLCGAVAVVVVLASTQASVPTPHCCPWEEVATVLADCALGGRWVLRSYDLEKVPFRGPYLSRLNDGGPYDRC